jgi:hypothetical protein
VAIFIDKVELDEPVAMKINIDAFDVDGGPKPSVDATEKGGTVSLQTDVGTGVDEAELGCRGGDMTAESRGGSGYLMYFSSGEGGSKIGTESIGHDNGGCSFEVNK